MAAQGWILARAAGRRLTNGAAPASGLVDGLDRNADLGQGIEALDRAFRYTDLVLSHGSGLSLPTGPEWSEIRQFVRRGRDAIAHGDERLSEPGLGYYITIKDGLVTQFGKAKRERNWRTDVLPVAELIDSVEVLTNWLLFESSVT